jgi:hypothetical protein
MRKLLLSITFALLMVQPVNAEVPRYAWYNSRMSLAMPFYGNSGNFTASAFSVKQEGLYTLVGDQFVTTYQDMIRLSGTCYQVKPNGQYLTARLPQSGREYPLAWEVYDKTYSFSVAFPALGEPVVLSMSGLATAYNETFCNVLFEAVG